MTTLIITTEIYVPKTQCEARKMGYKAPKVRIPVAEHPRCTIEGCCEPKAIMDWNLINGQPKFRPICLLHHQKRTADKHGLANIKEVWAKNLGFTGPNAINDAQDFVAQQAGFADHTEYTNYTNTQLAISKGFETFLDYTNYTNTQIAISKGFDNYVDYCNSKHPYRKHRKDYCENIDGRLDYTCTTTIVGNYLLDVDHIDGNPSNDKLENLQTLCACCHRVKTKKYEDYKTPGRKELGIKY